MHQLYCLREKVTRRENRLLNALYYVHSSFYKVAFGRAADSIESSNESPDECKRAASSGGPARLRRGLGRYHPHADAPCLVMIIDQTPLTSKFISLPKELSQLNCNAFIAGMIQAVLAALDFVSYRLALPRAMERLCGAECTVAWGQGAPSDGCIGPCPANHLCAHSMYSQQRFQHTSR